MMLRLFFPPILPLSIKIRNFFTNSSFNLTNLIHRVDKSFTFCHFLVHCFLLQLSVNVTRAPISLNLYNWSFLWLTIEKDSQEMDVTILLTTTMSTRDDVRIHTTITTQTTLSQHVRHGFFFQPSYVSAFGHYILGSIKRHNSRFHTYISIHLAKHLLYCLYVIHSRSVKWSI